MGSRESKTSQFKSFDGTELVYRIWKPVVESSFAVIYLHRGHEHSDRLSELVDGIGLDDCWGFTYDARGGGKPSRRRGSAYSFFDLVRDLDSFVNYVSEMYGIPIENMAVVANSVGAVVAGTWMHDYAPPIRGAVLAAPAFGVKLYVPFAIGLLRVLRRFGLVSFIRSYVKPKFLTHDQEQCRRYSEAEAASRGISVDVLLSIYDTSKRIIKDSAAIYIPTLILSAGSDHVVKNSAQKKFFAGLSSPLKEFVEYRGFYHAIFYEKQRQEAFDKSREFIRKCFETEVNRSFLLNAHKEGFSKSEYDRLSAGPGMFKKIMYGTRKLAMRTVGCLSEGIRLGYKHGFDSGKTLDYIYEDRARGTGLIGRMIDRNYLNAIGWVGIRQRKVHLEEILQEAVDRACEDGQEVHILDIASGPGRYLLEIVKANEERVSAHLRDYMMENVAAAREIAELTRLEKVTVEVGDAFDAESVASVEPKPKVAVISGLYELFPDNDMVVRSLNGVSECIQPGGYLVYTCQPWHPQLELIARTLPNREGDKWIMRRRCQAEMDELVKAAGFRKISMKIDDYGIFSVSLAVKEQ